MDTPASKPREPSSQLDLVTRKHYLGNADFSVLIDFFVPNKDNRFNFFVVLFLKRSIRKWGSKTKRVWV